ncbi:hypothetical protein Tco_1266088 [Tanacetum coccineum]
MQKYILKQQFEGFIVSNTDGIHKGYERFQNLLSQLEIHGAGIDSLSFDDLYNNLRVFENDVKSSTASSSNLPNVAFVSENTSLFMIKTKVDATTATKMGILQESVVQRKKTGGRDGGILEIEMGNRTGRKIESKALVTVDGECIDGTTHSKAHDRKQGLPADIKTLWWPVCSLGRFLVGYSLQSKAFRVYNLITKRVEENLHINFLENKPNVAGIGPNWLFDLDYLTDSMNYHNDSEENQANLHAGQQESKQDSGTKDKIDSGNSQIEDETDQDCFELPIWHSYSSTNKSSSKSDCQRGSPREEEQIFLDDLARLQIQGRKGKLNEEAEALRKNHRSRMSLGLLKEELLSQAVLTILVLLAQQLKLAVLTLLILAVLTLLVLIQPILKKMTLDFLYFEDNHLDAMMASLHIHLMMMRLMLVLGFKSLRITSNLTARQKEFLDSDYVEQILTGNPQQEVVNFLAGDSLHEMQKSKPLYYLFTEAEYVAAASCCGQVLWIQNQMLDYRSPKPIRIHFNRPITHAISSTDILNLQALISLTDDLYLRSNMAALESCPKHNMIAYLEKTEGNVEFHEVIDFLQRSYISHALTVSPVVSTTFVEQFWTSAKSKTINNVRHITAKVAGKSVSISEASIRTDLIFDDADGIDSSSYP